MGNPLKLLLVEDSVRDADLAVSRLTQAGYDVSHQRVEDGSQMQQALQTQAWDVIIADYTLRGFDSQQALQLLKGSGLDIPFIILSGAMGEEIAVRAIKSGAYDYVLKNNLIPLATAVEEALADAKARGERRQAEKALRQNETQFRDLFENAPLGYMITAPDGLIQMVNRRLAEMLQYTPAELSGRPVTTLHPPSSAAVEKMAAALHAKIVSDQSLTTEDQMLRKDGTNVWVELVIRPVFDSSGKPVSARAAVLDITERKQAEKALGDSEKRFHSLFENMMNGFAYCRMIFENEVPVDFTYLEVNDAFEKLTGLKSVTGKKVSEVIPGIRHSDPELLETYGRGALGGKPEHFETFVEALKMWFDVAVYSPARGFFVAIFDVITERKQAEEEILRLNYLYSVTSNVNQAVIRASDPHQLLDEVCTILAERGNFKLAWMGVLEPASQRVIPAAACGATNYLKDILLYADKRPEGRGPTGTSIREQRPIILNDFMNSPETERWHARAAEYGFRSSAAFPITFGGKIWGALSVYSDITGYFGEREQALLEETTGDISFALDNMERERQRKLADEALHTSQRLIEGIINTIPVRVFWKDKDLVYLGCNAEFARDAGLADPRDIIGKDDYQMVWREQAELYRSDDRQVIASGRAKLLIEEPQTTPGGKVITLLTSKVPLLSSKGEVIGIIGTYIDITERKKTEAEQQRLRDKAEMSSRLAAVGEMAAGIAHEINNPLTGVIGFAEILMERSDLPGDVRDDLSVISEGSKRMADIVKRLLTFARQTQPYKTSTDLNELIDNTLTLRAYVLKTGNIEVVTSYERTLPWVTVDPGQLQQVFINLIVNAEHAMKASGGKLTITTEKCGDHICISFRDTGYGIPPEVMEHLFEPFFTTKEPGEGTGLGLSLSRSIILEHGGELRAESPPGGGAKFTIELPIIVSEPAETAPQSPTEAGDTAASKANILVVDDEEATRKLLDRVLERAGHTVDTTGDPREALDKIDKVSYDLLLIDVRLPGMSGTELYERIMEKAPRFGGRVIFITGDTADADLLRYLKKAGVPYAAKPFDVDDLLRQIRSLPA